MELYVGSKGNHILGLKVRMVMRVIGMTEQCCKVKTLAGRGIPSCFGSGTSLACLALPFLPAATNSSIDHIPYFLPNSCWHLASEQIFWSPRLISCTSRQYVPIIFQKRGGNLSFFPNQPTNSCPHPLFLASYHLVIGKLPQVSSCAIHKFKIKAGGRVPQD